MFFLKEDKWEKECLSIQSERQGIGRVKFGFSTLIRTSIK